MQASPVATLIYCYLLPRKTKITAIPAMVAQRRPMPAMKSSRRVSRVLGGGTSGISIFLDLKTRDIAEAITHLLCQI